MTPEEILNRPYHWIIQYSDPSWAASILEFPGCYAQGDTPEEATIRLRKVALSWISAALEKKPRNSYTT